MALLHYIYTYGSEYGIVLSALNCDHGIRGEQSARDSEFVKDWCKSRGVPLLFFKWENTGQKKTEGAARVWRFKCYSTATYPSGRWKNLSCPPQIFSDSGAWQGADAVATAHHLDDNAETVLFNLARGTGLAGMCGISGSVRSGVPDIIHPLVGCARAEIDEYVRKNGIPYVDDETNFGDGYTRNKIRHNVLPELERAVPGAAQSIYRFSRLAAEYEDYLDRKAREFRVKCAPYGDGILRCDERVLFKRAALDILFLYGVKDYTSAHLDKLYGLQFADKGKKFCFLGLTAINEEDKIVLVSDALLARERYDIPFSVFVRGDADNYFGQPLVIAEEDCGFAVTELRMREQAGEFKLKTLRFDFDCIPASAVVREMRIGDRFTKFGGGTKNLGDYFTDKKIPQRVRTRIPVIADGSRILAVCGVEISEDIKTTKNTVNTGYIISREFKGE